MAQKRPLPSPYRQPNQRLPPKQDTKLRQAWTSSTPQFTPATSQRSLKQWKLPAWLKPSKLPAP